MHSTGFPFVRHLKIWAVDWNAVSATKHSLLRVYTGIIAQCLQYLVHKGLLIPRGDAWLQRASTRPWTQHIHLSAAAPDCPFPCFFCTQVMRGIACICNYLWSWCEWPTDPGSKGGLEVDINWTEELKWQHEICWWDLLKDYEKCWNGRSVAIIISSLLSLCPHLPCRGLQGK